MNRVLLLFVLVGGLFCSFGGFGQAGDLRVVLIRHGEKPWKGDGLTCQGINRSKELVGLLHSRFGAVGVVYVPNKGKGDTKRSRMYQTALPYASAYHVAMNTEFHEDELKEMAKSIRQQHGVVLVVWEHSGIPEIARRLGVEDELQWKDKDYDSMWIVTFSNGRAVLTRDREGLQPATECR
jgi:hypothetical protein